jgi:hypothetical protein
MKRMMMNIAVGFTFAAVALAPGSIAQTQTQAQPSASAQDQDQSSLGDYARKIHKDSATAKPKPKVFDNDNIPRDQPISVVGEQSSATESAAATPAGTTPAATDKAAKPADSKDAAKPASADEEAKKQAAWKDWQNKLTAQKDAIDLAGRELDVLQREYQLRAAEMYADVGNRLRNQTEWDKQEAQYKQQIADKQKSVEDAKQKLDDMKEQARKAGVPSAMIE